MTRRLGAVSGAMIDKAMARECIHRVSMKYTCAICFEEFSTLRIRRMKSHVEHDWDPLLDQLDPEDGPLTKIIKGLGSDLCLDPKENWFEDELHARIPELDALMDPERGYNPYDDPLTVSAVRSGRIGGTD